MVSLRLVTIAILFGLTSLQAPAFGQEQERKPSWGPFQYFVGAWQGHETGVAGIGKGERVCELIMDDQYLLCRNISRFEPQERNPKGEIHKVSYDRKRQNFVSREFHSESYVIQYALDKGASTDKSLVLVSESVENASGVRARLTFQIRDEKEFEETFELASSGKDFKVYLKNVWTRVARVEAAPAK